MNVKISHIERIIQLSKKRKSKLRKINADLDRTYNGGELTKNQLIFQIVFQTDAPDANR